MKTKLALAIFLSIGSTSTLYSMEKEAIGVVIQALEARYHSEIAELKATVQQQQAEITGLQAAQARLRATVKQQEGDMAEATRERKKWVHLAISRGDQMYGNALDTSGRRIYTSRM